jgi:hypothetical protein
MANRVAPGCCVAGGSIRVKAGVQEPFIIFHPAAIAERE